MEKTMENLVLDIMRSHNVLTLATLREDGYPQANTVIYVNDGLTMYFPNIKFLTKANN